MKKLLVLLTALCSLATPSWAQLPNGSNAPDFTITDVVGGGSHSLHNKLDEGKTVFLDFFATWCGPCWSYHNSGALEGIWETYGPPGTDQAFVMAIEGDNATNTNCIFGPSGCVGGTQGNWAGGTPYPIGDDAAIANLYNINFFPTIYCVCPWDKKVWQCGQLSTAGLWNYRNQKCTAPPMAIQIVETQNVVCFGQTNGSIDIEVSGGVPPYTFNWSNGQHTEDLTNLAAGNYTCTVVSSQGAGTKTVGPIQIAGPSSAVNLNLTVNSVIGCTVPGMMTASASGGWQTFTYQWSNGFSGEVLETYSPGLFTVTATDANGCTKVKTQSLTSAPLPLAQVAAPAQLTCANATSTLNGSASSSGQDITYNWVVGQGGNLVSGQGTSTAVVNQPATYVLQVINSVTGCSNSKTVTVAADQTYPTADAGANGMVTCAATTTNLQGTGSTGNNFQISWTGINGGTVQSGGNTLTPTVSTAGGYILQITNTDNGCFKKDTALVAANNAPPTVALAAPILTCAATAAPISTTTSAQNPTFAWTGPNGFSSNLQNPTVGEVGNFSVVVTDGSTGCTKNESASVTANTTPPEALAQGGTLTCATTSVNLTGNSPSQNVNFAWTGPNGFASTLQNPTATAAGNYNLVVTSQANGCTSGAVATVSQNLAQPTVAIAAPANLNCNNSSVQLSGAASSQGSNFSYLWTTSGGQILSGETTLTPLVGAAGTYNLQVTNSDNGCQNSANTTVNQSLAVAATLVSQNNVACFGGSNGSAVAAGAGGNGNFSYLWSNGQTGSNLTNAIAGTYNLLVTDGENCTASTTVNISQPNILAANASATAQTQTGQNDGTATANPSGGTAGFNYLWSNGATTQTISGLAPGNYSVVITDANGCSDSQTVTVNSVNCALSASILAQNVACFGQNNGSATVNLQGAAQPVSYLWSNGATTATVENLPAGNFSVQIEDANGCPAELSVNISQPLDLDANATATGESAPGANDGTATAAPTGGTGNYSYAWSNGATSQSQTGLAPGQYTVVVTDANGCQDAQTIIVAASGCALAATVSQANVSCNGLSNGQATVALAGGAAPFTYLWSNGQNTATAQNLAVGNYSVQISDAVGCETSANVEITEPATIAVELVSQTNVVCPNDANGSATIAATGGTGDLNFLWENGQTGATATNLTAGIHAVAATDANGCVKNFQVEILANDNVPPQLSTQNLEVSVGSNGTVTISAGDVISQVSDNCAVASTQVSPNTFDCSQVGQTIEVVVAATDAAGNLMEQIAEVKVVDNVAPTVACPADVLACYSSNVVNYNSPVAEDNCAGQGQWNLLEGLPSGSAFPIGTTNQVYTYTDASGNVGKCEFEVKISSPTTAGGLTSGGCFQTCEGWATVGSVAGGTAPFTFQWSNGQTGSTATGICATGIQVQITDVAGCTTPQTINLSIPTPLVMQVVAVQNATNGQSNGAVEVAVAGGVAPYIYVWKDAQGNVVGSEEDLKGVPGGSYNLQITDANGCVIQNIEGIVVQNTSRAGEPEWAKGLRLVPNPTSGLVQVRFADLPKNEVLVAIFDAVGREVLRLTSTGERVIEMDLSALPSAIYSVQLRSAGGVSVRKLVVER